MQLGNVKEAQLAYCREHILPIWERWTDGNLAARQLLECDGADPASHVELFGRLMAITHELRARDRDASTEAALAAASVCCDAYIGVPPDRFEAACTRATAAHITALVADGEADRELMQGLCVSGGRSKDECKGRGGVLSVLA
jgi:hypothetical protein